MENKAKPTRLPVADQPKGTMYEMSMRFVGDAGLKSINDMLSYCGLQDRVIAEQAVTLRIEQVVPFIPDDDTIQKYIQVLTEAHAESKSEITVENIRFDGYDYLYAVRPTA